MADIQALAYSAAKRLEGRNALNEADAISKAIRGAGITNKSDHARLMREVGRQLACNKRDAEREVTRGRSSRH